jgi:hypothetical protein
LPRDGIAEDEPARSTDSSTPFTLDLLAFVLAGVVVPLCHVWTWNGGLARRRWPALPSSCSSTPLLIIVDTRRDPTSHNLWPFEIVMLSGGGSVVTVGGLTVVRRSLRAEA